MGKRISQFCENLRQKLVMIDSGPEGLKAKIDSNGPTAERHVQSHLERVRKRIDRASANVSAARADVTSWVQNRNAVAVDTVALWRIKRDVEKLQCRADKAKRYAAAATEVATAAIDEAEQASLEAWLAQADADYATSTQTA
jgi:predicted type IV restriction endonuclease